MPGALELEDFLSPEEGTMAQAPDPGNQAADMAYETGYRAGWEDGAQASGSGEDQVSSALIHSLQEAGFTFHEARAAVTASLAPLIEALCGILFPQLMAEAVAAAITDSLDTEVEAAVSTSVDLKVAEPDLDIVSRRVPDRTALPVAVTADPALQPGQAYLSIGAATAEIDLAQALSAAQTAIDAFYRDLAMEKAHA